MNVWGFTSPARSCWAAAVRPGPAPACSDRPRSPSPGSTLWVLRGWGGRLVSQTESAGGPCRRKGGVVGWCADAPPEGRRRKPRGKEKRSSRMRRTRSSRSRSSPGFDARGLAAEPPRLAEEAGRAGCSHRTWRGRRTLEWVEERVTAAAPGRAEDSGLVPSERLGPEAAVGAESVASWKQTQTIRQLIQNLLFFSLICLVLCYRH